MKKAIALLLTLLLGVCAVLPCFAVDDPDFVAAAEEAKNKPMLYLTDLKGKAGSKDIYTSKLLMAHAKGVTACDIVIQYNPYMLEFVGFEQSKDIAEVKNLEHTEPGLKKDIYGNIPHEVYIMFFHLEEFGPELDTCEIGTLQFRAIGGGVCPLELTAMDVEVKGKEVKSVAVGGEAKVEGEEASGWDYTAITSAYLTTPDPDKSPYYVVTKNGGLQWWMIVLIGVGALVLIGVIVLFVLKGRNYIADSEEYDQTVGGKQNGGITVDMDSETPVTQSDAEEKEE